MKYAINFPQHFEKTGVFKVKNFNFSPDHAINGAFNSPSEQYCFQLKRTVSPLAASRAGGL